MTWFGTASAWGAVMVGLVFAAAAARNFPETSSWGPTISAVLLFMGAYRTLRQLPGGLRLLAGAWGLAAGFSFYFPFGMALMSGMRLWVVTLVGLFSLFCFGGLALAVLHKEAR